VVLVLKYSPSTALTASGIESSFRALRSWSRAFTISSDIDTIIFCIAKLNNYVRPHMSLEGKTPADLAGIEVQGNAKWLTLIQNATKDKRDTS
jgi:hypothetical protein